ncbi:MAG: ketoacyl-ACP synthase III [Rhodospirillales bacterium]|jgi:3-oxoacyl-[acyl-carrier-protein] synthase-3|nr:ketoacyl-ACP synthase III [Rhodospirillales bacterium]
MTGARSRIIGCGSYLPERVLSNDELAAQIETSDDWIVTRTGIQRRHIAAEGELTSDLAAQAARRALAHAGTGADEVDLVVVATSTPDDTFPATATQVQAKLGLTTGAAFDVQAVCSGFVFALAVADNFIRAGQAATALVIGAETYSRILDWDDRGTCVLFGDGAGAVVVSRTTELAGPARDRQPPAILSTHLHSDGRHRDILYVDGGPSRTGTVGKLRMSGREVFRHAVSCLAQVAEEALAANGLAIADIDWLIPHQANKRILEGVAKKLSVPKERVISTVEIHANTSAASIPLALDLAVRDGRIASGDLILFEAIGGGLTWGAALVRW